MLEELKRKEHEKAEMEKEALGREEIGANSEKRREAVAS